MRHLTHIEHDTWTYQWTYEPRGERFRLTEAAAEVVADLWSESVSSGSSTETEADAMIRDLLVLAWQLGSLRVTLQVGP